MKGIVMADEAELQATSNEEASVENTAESHTEEQSNAPENQQSEQAQESEADTSTSNQDAASDKQSEAKDDSQPASHQSRRSSKFMAQRIEKLANENANLKRERQASAQDEWEAPASPEESQPDIQALIAQEVEKRLHPVISESSKNADDGEIAELFSGEKAAERSTIEPRIRAMWNEPQYKDVAAEDLYKIAKYDELASSMDSVRIQAVEDYKKAQKEAKDSSARGTSNISNRTGNGGKSIADMTDEEFIAHNERIKLGFTK